MVDESKIRSYAYELWLARGCPNGSDQEDWFRAKEEVERQMNEAVYADAISEEPTLRSLLAHTRKAAFINR